MSRALTCPIMEATRRWPHNRTDRREPRGLAEPVQGGQGGYEPGPEITVHIVRREEVDERHGVGAREPDRLGLDHRDFPRDLPDTLEGRERLLDVVEDAQIQNYVEGTE